MSSDVLVIAADLVRRHEAFALATVVWRRAPSSGQTGAKAIVLPDGSLQGWIGGACAEPVVVREALAAMRDGQPRLVLLGEPDDGQARRTAGVVSVAMACQSEGALEVYIEPVRPKPEILVVGRSPTVKTLCALAQVLGWRATAVDPALLAQPPAGSIVVVATYGHGDENALAAVLAADASYVGLVASAKRAALVIDDMRRRGIPEEVLRRVHAPAGLDLGAVDHEEIAVAILAELVALKASGKLPAFQQPVAVDTRPEAVDPICGMPVDVRTARHVTVREGRTYYFCCATCLARFQER